VGQIVHSSRASCGEAVSSLLALVNNENELAGVIGHEIGHVATRHSVQKISKQGPVAAAANPVRERLTARRPAMTH
jgi:predicted Zn-dependent protease